MTPFWTFYIISVPISIILSNIFIKYSNCRDDERIMGSIFALIPAWGVFTTLLYMWMFLSERSENKRELIREQKEQEKTRIDRDRRWDRQWDTVMAEPEVVITVPEVLIPILDRSEILDL